VNKNERLKFSTQRGKDAKAQRDKVIEFTTESLKMDYSGFVHQGQSQI
jgi:hypothetical protein